LHLSGLGREGAKVGSLLEDGPGLPEEGLGAGHISERDVGAREFQEGLDGAMGQGAGEPWPQTIGPGEVVLGSGDVAAVQRCAGC
jgi:hypothetical protein